MFRAEGVWVAMLTPFDPQGAIDEAELRRMVDFHAASGVDGLFPVSTVGEFIHLDRAEKLRLVEVIVDQSRGRLRVAAGVGGSEPAECIRLARRAQELGCDAVVLPPPYFYPLSPEELAAFLETVVRAVALPVVLYNIPLFTQPLPYATVARLARHENVVAMKDSSGSMVDFMHFMDAVARGGGRLEMLTGREETLLACLAVGGSGCMTATAGILPEVMTGIWGAYRRGDMETARQRQQSILPLLREMFALPFPLGFKLGLEARGFRLGPPRHLAAAVGNPAFDRAAELIRSTVQALAAEADPGR